MPKGISTIRGAALFLCLLGAQAAHGQTVITTSTTSDVFDSGAKFYTHCVQGHYWVALDDGSNVILYSSSDGTSFTSQGAIFSFNPGINQWAVRYQADVIIAFAFNGADNTRYYRKGVLNVDGTVTWDAAEATVGAADASWPELNGAIVLGKPILWRAGPNNADAGRFTIGDQLDAPVVWTDTPVAPSLGPAAIPGNGTDGGLSAGAVLPTGGPDPNDLIVLRATSAAVASPGSHRLVAVKYDASLNAFDGQWYSVSTLGGTLTEDNSTEVTVTTDSEVHRRFGAVQDSNGNIHAVYVNRNGRAVHYEKDVGFNDSWSQIGTDITQSSGLGKISLTAGSNGNVFLFYERSNTVFYRRFDGTAWGAENSIFTGVDIQRSLGAMETIAGCAPAIAFNVNNSSPFDVTFSLLDASCGYLTTSEGSGTLTVTAPSYFSMTFREQAGGAIRNFFDLAENPTQDLGGQLVPLGIHNSGMLVGGVNYNSSSNGTDAQLTPLEVTATRVRVRQRGSYEAGSGTLLEGVKGIGDYSIYPTGKLALNWDRRTTLPISYSTEYHELIVHYTSGVPPLDSWAVSSETDNTQPNPASDAFILAQNEVVDARTDFLHIRHEDWTIANGHLGSADDTRWNFSAGSERMNAWWHDNSPNTIPAGSSEEWNFLTYFKPTNFVNEADPAVTGRSNDYETPDPLSIMVGGPWLDASERTSSGDDFNEGEGAYSLTFDPSLGLRFAIDGGTTTRYSPAFKIRQWRSLQDPLVTLDSSPLSNDLDFRADVKPVSVAEFTNSILFHSTLHDSGSVTNPDIGDASGTTESGVAYVSARYGNGVEFDSGTDALDIPIIGGDGRRNVELDRGRIHFWYKPNYDHNDNVDHYLFDLNNIGFSRIRLVKEGVGLSNQLTAELVDSSGASHSIAIPETNYSWQTGEWIHLALAWDSGASTANIRVFMNERLLSPTAQNNGTFTMEAESASGYLRLGNRAVGGLFSNADGIFDELTVLSSPGPSRLAYGGLTSSNREFLANPARNVALPFVIVDGNQRGEYFFVGSDSEFRGLNVSLATAGVGSADLQWDYWNGTAWTSLESGFGFTDETNNLTQPGTIYWTGTPSDWSEYSVEGGPELYFVRASAGSGSYSMFPAEAVLKTDILLVQYCGNITADGQVFEIAVPVPTAVELESFSALGVDGSAVLEWETASEIDNLGFHLYRSRSSEGPFERITSAPIPGLGSSPVGARYRYTDEGLANGATYYYELEDVDASGKTTRHGPVAATPRATSAAELQDEVSTAITYGDPELSALDVKRQGRHGLILELRTGGFSAEPQEDGSVRLTVPGFEHGTGPAAIPVWRGWLEVLAGGNVEVVSVRADDVEWVSLRPSEADATELVASRDGTVRVQRRRARRAFRARGLPPSEEARVVDVAFQGETRKALLELAPLRWDPKANRLWFARRLTVRLSMRRADRSVNVTRHRRRSSTRASWRFATKEPGLYGVRYEELFRSGRGMPTDELSLSRQGEDVAFHVEPRSGWFRPGSTLYFVSEGAAANPYGREAVYELEVGVSGVAMESADGAPSGPPISWYRHDVVEEENHLYQAALVEAPDPWLWEFLLAPMTKSFRFDVDHLAPVSDPARLTIRLQGASDTGASTDHHVRAWVNRSLVGETRFNGKRPETLDVEIPPGVLLEGGNELAVENVGDTDAPHSMVMVDGYELTYPRLSASESGILTGTWTATGTATLSGFGGESFVLDVTESTPRWLTGVTYDGHSNPAFRSLEQHRYLVVRADEVLRPALRAVPPSNLRRKRNRADYLVIAPRAFLSELEPLIALRREQGLRAKAVSVESIVSEFGYGEENPEALRAFLSYAYHEWRQPSLRYVVLVGDATYDFKDYLQTGVTSRVPPMMVKTSYLWTASDPSYAAVHGDDGLPDLAIGRLPAASLDEVRAMVAKIDAYESGEAGIHRGPIVLVADDPDAAGDFEADARALATSILAGRASEVLLLRERGVTQTRRDILASFDEGASVVSYLGHGGINLWATENVFNTGNTELLVRQTQQPLVLTMNCLNGYFHFPYFDALAETLVKLEERGAIAAFSPSGLSLNEPAQLLHRAVLQELFHGGHQRLGDALLAAQAEYTASGAFPELLAIYHLFGDPALVLK